MVFNLSSMKINLYVNFIISSLEQIFLSAIWSFVSQDMNSWSQGTKQIYQHTIKILLAILPISEKNMANFNPWNLFHHLPRRINFPTRYNLSKSDSRISIYSLQKSITQYLSINFHGSILALDLNLSFSFKILNFSWEVYIPHSFLVMINCHIY